MKKLLCTVALVGMLVAPGVVQAQMQIGPLLGYNADIQDGTFGVGGHLLIPVPQLAPGFAIVPNFIFYFPDGFDALEVNGDVAYNFPVSADSPVMPFAFAGLNYLRFSGGGGSSSDIGLNLGGGVGFAAGSLSPFAGAKFEIQDGTGFVIFGGLGFTIGGGA